MNFNSPNRITPSFNTDSPNWSIGIELRTLTTLANITIVIPIDNSRAAILPIPLEGVLANVLSIKTNASVNPAITPDIFANATGSTYLAKNPNERARALMPSAIRRKSLAKLLLLSALITSSKLVLSNPGSCAKVFVRLAILSLKPVMKSLAASVTPLIDFIRSDIELDTVITALEVLAAILVTDKPNASRINWAGCNFPIYSSIGPK